MVRVVSKVVKAARAAGKAKARAATWATNKVPANRAVLVSRGATRIKTRTRVPGAETRAAHKVEIANDWRYLVFKATSGVFGSGRCFSDDLNFKEG